MGMTAQALELAVLGAGVAGFAAGMLPHQGGGGSSQAPNLPLPALGSAAMDAADRVLGQQWAASQQGS